MAGDWALHIEQGATFDVTLTWKDSVVLNLPWTTVDSHFADIVGPGMITADVADVTGWT